MPLPVVANLFLCRLVWQDAGAPRNAINDLFIHDDVGGHTGTDVFNALDAHVTSGMWNGQQVGSAIFRVITTKLDGSAASETHDTGSPSKWKGAVGAGDFITGGTNVVTLRTGFRGRSRRGRVYLPWVAEAAQSDGTIDGATVTNIQNAWNTFFAAMHTAGFPLHVCSRKNSDSIEVSSVTAQPFVKSQRRRNRR